MRTTPPVMLAAALLPLAACEGTTTGDVPGAWAGTVDTREFTPQPVTAEDRERARERLEWFTAQGGRIDLSRIPDTKPPVESFFVDSTGHVWVARTDSGASASVSTAGARDRLDVFDPDGRFLGTVELPFDLRGSPYPIIRGDHLYGVASDALGVLSVVRARIVRPEGSG